MQGAGLQSRLSISVLAQLLWRGGQPEHGLECMKLLGAFGTLGVVLDVGCVVKQGCPCLIAVSLAGRDNSSPQPQAEGSSGHCVHTGEVLPLLQLSGSLRKAACTSRGTA